MGKEVKQEIDQLEQDIAEAINTEDEKELRELDKDLDSRPLIHTGSIMLNLACANNVHGGYPLGAMANLIGDSFAGKTLLALTMLAQAAYSDRFSDHRLVYDDVERRFMFDPNMFGEEFGERLESPPHDHSDTIFDFYKNVKTLIKEGKPFIYVLDSLDSLTGGDEEKRLMEMADGKGGGYGMVKPKALSEILRDIRVSIKDLQSFVLIISQTRDNISAGFAEKRRAGGRALKFYCTHEIWLARTGTIKKTVKGVTREVGATVKAKISKNSLTGKPRTVEFSILHDYGVDDIEAAIDFLLKTEVFKKVKKSIEAPPFDFKGTKDSFISFIEEDYEREKKLYELVDKVWNELEQALKPSRRPKFKRS